MSLNQLAIEMFGWPFDWLLISERRVVLREMRRRKIFHLGEGST